MIRLNKFISTNTRTAKVLKNIFITVILRGVNILISFLLIPMTIGYINKEQYGIWLTLTSIVAWSSFFDLGFGNGLRNKLAESVSLGDYSRGKALISTGYFMLGAIFLGVCLITFFIVPYINWNEILNTDIDIEWNKIVRVTVTMFCFQLVLNLINTIASALLQHAISSIITTIGQVCMLLGIYLLTNYTQPNMFYLALCLMGIPNTVYLIVSLCLYSFHPLYSRIRPSLKAVKFQYARDILGLGTKFFILQVCALLMYHTANVIIIRQCGPQDVTSYNIAYKYYSVLAMASGLILAPLWSAFTDAYTRKDYPWMKQTFKHLKRAFGVGCLSGVLLCLISPFVYSVWLGDAVSIPWSLSVCMMIYFFFYIWNYILSTLLNGIGKIRISMIFCAIAMLVYIPIAVAMCQWFGSKGVVMAIAVVNIPFSILGYIQINKLLNGRSTGIWNR
jgi:O-antigen/teichoic acid export membrane protein